MIYTNLWWSLRWEHLQRKVYFNDWGAHLMMVYKGKTRNKFSTA